MATVRLLSDEELDPEAAEVFADIRATRGGDFVNNFWRALAHDPKLLAEIWGQVKATMQPGALDGLTKELIYIAVSAANACSYCLHSHTAAARAKGMTEAQHAELLAVLSLAARTNHLVTAMQVPVDPEFDVGA
jgi:AhpD family alkylhydroperoxidase